MQCLHLASRGFLIWAATASQKRRTSAIRSVRLLDSFIVFRRSSEMGFFLVLSWCLAVVGFNSRFGAFNSRLGGREFPFRRSREFARKGLIWLSVCPAEWRLRVANRKSSRFNGNNREFRYGASFDMMIVPEAANMPPTP